MSIELPPLSFAANAARTAMERATDPELAAAVATQANNAAGAAITAVPSSMATALTAHTLLAHAVISSAATWLSTHTKVPLPEAHRAIVDMVLNPHPIFTTDISVDGKPQ